MSWTEKPTEPGYYWTRWKNSSVLTIVYVNHLTFKGKPESCPVDVLGDERGASLDQFSGWLKIEPPGEVKFRIEERYLLPEPNRHVIFKDHSTDAKPD